MDDRLDNVTETQWTLSPVGNEMVGWIGLHLYAPHTPYRWRRRGQTPGPDAISRVLWDGVVAQYSLHSGHGVSGLIQLYDVDFRSGHGYLSLMLDPIGWESDGARRATMGFIERSFSDFPLRKLYIQALETDEAVWRQTLGEWLTLEGRLSDHERSGGEYKDLLIFAIDRTDVVRTDDVSLL
jgi:RimJ/RimL family protein N-acetyltransferase